VLRQGVLAKSTNRHKKQTRLNRQSIVKQIFEQHALAGLMTFARKANCVSLILLFLQSAPATAGPLEDANAAIKRRDYATAARIIRPEAERGDANAQYNLGLFYDNGLGVPQDHIRAYMWLSLAQRKGEKMRQLCGTLSPDT
jgi:TPR repeat protein